MARVWNSAVGSPCQRGSAATSLTISASPDWATLPTIPSPIGTRRPRMSPAALPRTTRKKSSWRSSSSSQIELVSARQTVLGVLQRQLQHGLELERAGELDADVEQRLVLGETAVGLERGPVGRAIRIPWRSSVDSPCLSPTSLRLQERFLRAELLKARAAARRPSGSARPGPSSGSAGWPSPAAAGSRATGCSAPPAPPATAWP